MKRQYTVPACFLPPFLPMPGAGTSQILGVQVPAFKCLPSHKPQVSGEDVTAKALILTIHGTFKILGTSTKSQL